MSDADIVKIVHLRALAGLTTSPDNFRNIKYSVDAGCYAIFSNPDSHPGGYLLWVNACQESVDLFMRTGLIPQYPYEWNEGEIALLIDVVIMNTYGHSILSQLKSRVRKFDRVVYNRGGRRVILKEEALRLGAVLR